MKYRYEMEGSSARDQYWAVGGEVEGTFAEAIGIAQMEAFEKLTQGKAVFGHPGVGCSGPYKINYFILERMAHD